MRFMATNSFDHFAVTWHENLFKSSTIFGKFLQYFLQDLKIYTVFFLYFLYYFLFGCALREFFATRLVEFDWKCKDRLKASANCQSRSTVYIILNIYTNRASIYIQRGRERERASESEMMARYKQTNARSKYERKKIFLASTSVVAAPASLPVYGCACVCVFVSFVSVHCICLARAQLINELQRCVARVCLWGEMKFSHCLAAATLIAAQSSTHTHKQRHTDTHIYAY